MRQGQKEVLTKESGNQSESSIFLSSQNDGLRTQIRTTQLSTNTHQRDWRLTLRPQTAFNSRVDTLPLVERISREDVNPVYTDKLIDGTSDRKGANLNQSETLNCPIPEHPLVREVFVYRKEDKFAGFIVQFKEAGSREILEELPVFEVLMTPVDHLEVKELANSDVQSRVIGLEVRLECNKVKIIFIFAWVYVANLLFHNQNGVPLICPITGMVILCFVEQCIFPSIS